MNNDALGLVHISNRVRSINRAFLRQPIRKHQLMQIAAGFGLDTCDLNNESDPQAALQAIIRRPSTGVDPCAH